jgi:hypothetical protein
MANRSTFGRNVPRDVGRLAALARAPEGFKKRVLLPVTHPQKGPKVDADGKGVSSWQILPDYDRMVRHLLMDGHKSHRAFKLKRLTKDVTADTAEDKAAEVSTT